MGSPRHHRRAALPAPGFTRAPTIDPSGLVFTLFAEDGAVIQVFRFTGMRGSAELRRALVCSIDLLSGPGGRWRARDTVGRAFYATKYFLEFLSGLADPPATAEAITADLVAAWRLSQADSGPRRNYLSAMRHILLNVDGVSAQVTRALSHRVGRVRSGPQASYTLKEYEQIRRHAWEIFHPALLRIRAGRAHLGHWLEGGFPAGTNDYMIGEVLDHLRRTGVLPGSENQRWNLWPYRHAVGGWSWQDTTGRLFLTSEEVFALTVLLVASEGWNPGVMAAMRVPTHDPAVGDAIGIYRVELEKPRRPAPSRHTSNNLVDDAPGSPGRLMRQAIEATEPARQALAFLGAPTERLLVSRSRRPGEGAGGFLLGVPAGGRRAYNTTANGEGPRVNLQRLRRTVQVRIRKEPAQNSQGVHDSVYVQRDESSIDASKATLARGLNDALDHARTVTEMKMMLGDDSEVLLELADHPELARAVLAGRADTATGACADFTDGPHAAPGTACPASFLWCLSCRNAIATRRHLPRLCYLHACLESLRSTLAAPIWEADWHEHHQRLGSLLDRHTTTAERHAHTRCLSDADRDLVDRLLHRKLDI